MKCTTDDSKNGGNTLKKNVLVGMIISVCILSACGEKKVDTMTTSSSAATSTEVKESHNNIETTVASESSASSANETIASSGKANGGYDGSKGPLTYKGSVENGFTIYQYDIETGNKNEVFVFKNNHVFSAAAKYDAFNTGILSCYQSKSFFSEDMTKFAVSWVSSTDSSNRVGWINKDDKLTDVTKAISPTSSDFTATTPKDYYPQFMQDGSFMYVDFNTKEYVYVDTETLGVIRREAIEERGTWEDKLWDVIILPNGKKVTRVFGDSGRRPTIDFGDYAVEFCTNKYAYAGSLPWSGQIAGYDLTNEGVIFGIGYKEDKNAGVTRTSIAKYGPGITESEEKLDGKGNKYICYDSFPKPFVALTPTTEYNLESCAYNDGRIAFIGTRGSERYLFVIDDGDAEQSVKQVVAIPADERLLFWR